MRLQSLQDVFDLLFFRQPTKPIQNAHVSFRLEAPGKAVEFRECRDASGECNDDLVHEDERRSRPRGTGCSDDEELQLAQDSTDVIDLVPDFAAIIRRVPSLADDVGEHRCDLRASGEEPSDACGDAERIGHGLGSDQIVVIRPRA